MGLNWTYGQLQPVRECPACFSSSRAGVPLRCRDYLGAGGEDEWCNWRCADCGSIFLDPRPDNRSLGAAYAGYYTHEVPRTVMRSPVGRAAWSIFDGYLRKEFGLNAPLANRWGWLFCRAFPPLRLKLDYHARHLFARHFPGRGKLLDVGCGNGDFLGLAASMGWEVAGIDVDPRAVEIAKSRGLNVLCGEVGSLPKDMLGSFQAITLNNTIEHLPDPGRALRALRPYLASGGRIWIATPNPQGVGSRVFGASWRGLEPSRHLCVPSQKQLRRLLAEAGYERIELHPRGEHGKTICRESAQVWLQLHQLSGIHWRAVASAVGWAVRLIASIAGSVSGYWAEETVMTATREGGIGNG